VRFALYRNLHSLTLDVIAMICCPSVQKCVIQRHYDVATLFYRLLWGCHIHHGLWRGDENAEQAQVQLVDQLADLARVTTSCHVLDVGCGIGGSSIHLAKRYGCSVTGVTLSPVQRRWAAASSRWHRVHRTVQFICADAEVYSTTPASLDVLWSVECTEHLFDKAGFFQRAAAWLRPGGRVAICAWLAGEIGDDARAERLVREVCEGFFCPSLGTMQDYQSWFQQSGLRVTVAHDWTHQVAQTWEICRHRVARTGLGWIAPLLDPHGAVFLERFSTILEAYRTGAMQYGCFVAEKPLEATSSGTANSY
jgi:tocopherol O-methyltransferase